MRQRAKPLGIIIGWPGQQVRSNRVRPPDELALTPGGIQPLFACQDCTFCRSVHRAGVCDFFHVEPARQELVTLAIGKTVSGTDFSDRMGWTGQFPECAQSATRFDSPPVRKRDLGTVKGDSLSAPRATEKRVCSAWDLAQGGFFKFTYSGRQLS